MPSIPVELTYRPVRGSGAIYKTWQKVVRIVPCKHMREGERGREGELWGDSSGETGMTLRRR